MIEAPWFAKGNDLTVLYSDICDIYVTKDAKHQKVNTSKFFKEKSFPTKLNFYTYYLFSEFDTFGNEKFE